MNLSEDSVITQHCELTDEDLWKIKSYLMVKTKSMKRRKTIA